MLERRMMFHKRAKRRATSPLIAEVALMAVTLVAGLAITGFVFGLVGNFMSNAMVSVTATSCNGKAGVLTCSFTASNTGSTSTAVTDVAATYGSNYLNGTAATMLVPAGQTVTFTGSWTIPTPLRAGSMITGVVALANGGIAPWAGTIVTVS
jgi:hypothetical protein